MRALSKGTEAANIQLAAANASIEKALDTIMHAVSALTTKIDMVTVEQANQKSERLGLGLGFGLGYPCSLFNNLCSL